MGLENEITITPTPKPEGEELSTEEYLAVQAKLWELLAQQTARYTMGESSSIPRELALELLDSLCYTIGLDKRPQSVKALVGVDLEERRLLGIKRLQAKQEVAKTMWEAACLTAPKVENLSLTDTLKSIGTFFKQYDLRYFAQDIPCSIDYQLAHPVARTLLGVDFIGEYLRHILIENELLQVFDPKRCVALLERYCPDYRGQLINLYEPVATNAIGLALVGGDIRSLNISKEECLQLESLFSSLAQSAAKEGLLQAARATSSALGLSCAGAGKYLEELAAGLLARILAALPRGLSNIFLSFV